MALEIGTFGRLRELLVGGCLHFLTEGGEDGLDGVLGLPGTKKFAFAGLDGTGLVIHTIHVDLGHKAALRRLLRILISTADGQEKDPVFKGRLHLIALLTPAGPTMVPFHSVKVVSSAMMITAPSTFRKSV